MTATVPIATRLYSTRELQAAAAALEAGRFSATSPIADAPGDRADRTNATEQSTGERRVQLPSQAWTSGVHSAVDGPTPVSGPAPLVRVRAANGGAGASTIALALADAADALGLRARVLDAAAPAWSGLLGATATELAAVGGWRRGCRGANVLIDRVEDPVQIPAKVPTPRAAEGVDVTVLDAGWSMRELTAASLAGTWLATAPARVEVLVTRPQALALSQTEAALADLEEQLAANQVVVVVVGASRWSAREFAAAGRLLREAHKQDAVLFTPLLPAKTLPGLGPDPLPRQLTIPTQRLLERITTITGPLTANRT